MTQQVDFLEIAPRSTVFIPVDFRITHKRVTEIAGIVILQTVGIVTARIMAAGKQIAPQTGVFSFPVGTIGTAFHFPVEIGLSGPPYGITVEAQSASGAVETGSVGFCLTSTDDDDFMLSLLGDIEKMRRLLGG